MSHACAGEGGNCDLRGIEFEVALKVSREEPKLLEEQARDSVSGFEVSTGSPCRR
jgi:hypothetical protein